MELTQDQINEVELFEQGLNELDGYTFWNLAVAVKDGRNGDAVTYEDKWSIMQRWEQLNANS